MMVIELIRKEHFERKEVTSKSKVANILSLLLKVIFIGCFIALECYIFFSLDKKIEKYSEYGTFDFLVLFLFAMMIVSIISSTVRARKTLFNHLDNNVLLPLPISTGELIFSKILYIYLKEVVTHFIVSTPILIVFGSTRMYIPYFYVFSILYPLLISLFSVGLALFFVVLYQFIYQLIKLSDIVQFILASILVIGLCFIYQVVLNLFLNALGDSMIGGVFDKNFIDSLHNSLYYLVPIYYLFNSVINGTNILSNVCILLGSIIISLSLGVTISSVAYIKLSKNEIDLFVKKENQKEIKMISQFRILLKKEFDIIFKDSGNIFSYTSLLIMAPFLTYVVISSLNTVLYQSLTQFLVYFPELINVININLIILFSSVINSSASLSMSREGRCVQIVKYIPISPFKQILAKLIIPTSLSIFSLLITIIMIGSSGVASPLATCMSLLMGILLIVSNNIYAIYIDMHDLSDSNNKLLFINELISIGFPVLILAFNFLMIFFGVPSYGMYLSSITLYIVLFVSSIIKMKSRSTKLFKRMEVR